MLETRGLSFFVNGKCLVDQVTFKLEPGRVCALLGPNGAGKSTLLKLMSGQLSPTSGEVLINGNNIESFPAPALARERAMLSQTRSVGFPFTAFEVALMGRHPHSSISGETDADRQITKSCLVKTDADYLARRLYTTLSGGEAARIDLARVLAQDTQILLLDEPTNHLDPRHQVMVLKLCRAMAAAGCAVAVCLHDLNLAAQFSDVVMVMKDGQAVADGPPEVVFTEELLEEVYEIPFMIWPHPDRGVCIMPDPEDGVDNLPNVNESFAVIKQLVT